MKSREFLPAIYPITDAILAGISHTEQVRRFIEGGASLIQLREKHLSPRAFYEDAKSAVALARSSGVLIVINDRVDIALALDADGVHLGQDDMPPAQARILLGEGKLIGYSTHSVRQSAEAAVMDIDYIAIGPIFETTTKENPDPSVGTEGIARVRAEIGDFPLVAIGGIKGADIRKVLNSGADSVAIISELLRPGDAISDKYKGFMDMLRL